MHVSCLYYALPINTHAGEAGLKLVYTAGAYMRSCSRQAHTTHHDKRLVRIRVVGGALWEEVEMVHFLLQIGTMQM